MHPAGWSSWELLSVCAHLYNSSVVALGVTISLFLAVWKLQIAACLSMRHSQGYCWRAQISLLSIHLLKALPSDSAAGQHPAFPLLETAGEQAHWLREQGWEINDQHPGKALD